MIFVLFSIGFITFIVWFFFKADGDLTLLFKEHFGKKIEDLNGKVIWITGASSGIGEALAHWLASVNAKLILSGTDTERLDIVRQACLKKGSLKNEDILTLPFNISDINIHKEAFQTVLNHFGKLDILVNNAGRSQRAPFIEIEDEVHRELFNINVFGPVNLAKTVLPHFLANKSGHYAVTSSTAGILGPPFSATYAATKHAMHGYFETIRSEHSADGINVTIFCPGPVISNIVKNAFTGKLGESFAGPDQAKKMSTKRCGQLMAIALVNRVDHAWITNQPVLTFHYFAQYWPSMFRNVIVANIPKSYIEKIRGGVTQKD